MISAAPAAVPYHATIMPPVSVGGRAARAPVARAEVDTRWLSAYPMTGVVRGIVPARFWRRVPRPPVSPGPHPAPRETYYDEALTGLMAFEILHGTPQVFYWGEPYGGAIGDAYPAALGFWLFGP